jgi:hypothetical protein
MDRVRASLKPRPRRPAQAPGAAPVAAAPVAAAQPPVNVPQPQAAGDLEARRARLAREYADLQFDLGGLVYEMAIRDSYRLDVITRQAAKLQAVDAQLTEIERSLTALAAPTPAAPPPAPPSTPPSPAPAPTANSAATAPTAVVPATSPPPAPAAVVPGVSTTAPTGVHCPSCSSQVEPGAAFCGTCGAQIGSTSPPTGAPSA